MLIERTIRKKIEPWLKREEIILLNGPRQAGKTTLMKQLQRECEQKRQKTFYLNLENPNDLLLTENYDLFLKTVLPQKGKSIVFLDEIQLHSRPSNFLKFLFDEHRSSLKLFVSGSANLDIKAKLQDSLVGRKKTFFLGPFHFGEFLKAKQFHPHKNPIANEKLLRLHMDEYLLYGGLPRIVLEHDPDIKRELLDEYAATYISKDIRHMIAENHVSTFNHVLIFLAKITGSLKNNAEISKELGLNYITLHRYLDLLEKTFVVDFLPPYFTNEITRIKKASKVYFFDNGVRNALLSHFAPLHKRNDAGALFENAVYLHLAQKYGLPHVFYLRTSTENEIDFVCQTSSGTLHAYEAKYTHFTKPTMERRQTALLAKLRCDKFFLVNQNFTHGKNQIRFIAFDAFTKRMETNS